MCCTMSSCCWSALSLCSLSVTFSFGWAEFHLSIVGCHTPLLSLPVTNVIGPWLLAPPLAWLLLLLLFPPHAVAAPGGVAAADAAPAGPGPQRGCGHCRQACRVAPLPHRSRHQWCLRFAGFAGGIGASALRV